MKSFIFNLCVLCLIIAITESEVIVESDDPSSKPVVKEKKDPFKDKRYLAEIDAGDTADLFSTNQHVVVPPVYKDFGRRFVVEYPYYEKSAAQIDEEAENRLDKAAKEVLIKSKSIDGDDKDEKLRPVKAPPEVVLAIAKQSALIQKSKPIKTNEFLQKDSLRSSGDYWNTYWKEDVPDPDKGLRSQNRLQSVKVTIMPGSKLYKLVSMTKDLSTRLVYVINEP